ncbi:hypothetical protein HZB90_03675 [archaeon]|nr:hypothetical protein [archaeon]
MTETTIDDKVLVTFYVGPYGREEAITIDLLMSLGYNQFSSTLVTRRYPPVDEIERRYCRDKGIAYIREVERIRFEAIVYREDTSRILHMLEKKRLCGCLREEEIE